MFVLLLVSGIVAFFGLGTTGLFLKGFTRS